MNRIGGSRRRKDPNEYITHRNPETQPEKGQPQNRPEHEKAKERKSKKKWKKKKKQVGHNKRRRPLLKEVVATKKDFQPKSRKVTKKVFKRRGRCESEKIPSSKEETTARKKGRKKKTPKWEEIRKCGAQGKLATRHRERGGRAWGNWERRCQKPGE